MKEPEDTQMAPGAIFPLPDGLLIYGTVTRLPDGIVVNERFYPWSDFGMVSREQVEAIKAEIAELETEIAELDAEFEAENDDA